MARKVKCFVTGEEGTSDVFVKKPIGKQNKYFKSNQIYEDYIKEKEVKDKLLIYISNVILNYREGQYLPTVLIKKINELASIYTYHVVLETFQSKEDTLQYWMGLDNKFKNEYAKVSYMMAIVNNSINDVYKEWQYKQKRKQSESIKVDTDILNVDIVNSKTKKDISEFL